MCNRILCIVFLLCMAGFLSAQEYRWGVEMDYFFDNREYKKSSFTDAQTLQGIWLKSQGKVTWDTVHSLIVGVNVLKMPGVKKVVDKAELTVYYQYRTDQRLFRIGAFPRSETLPNYSDFFFRDSVKYFMPLMQGVFWQVGKGDTFFNAWMDWTGYGTARTRESFFLGLSGKASKGIFFADFQSSLFHLAGTYPGNGLYGVSEQIQGMASAGVDYVSGNSFRGIVSAGLFAGRERDRKAGVSYRPVGFTARANAEYLGIGTENTFYAGDPRMRFYDQYGSTLYWGTPFLRGRSYLQSKWYLRLLESGWVRLRLNGNLHFSEGEVLFQQTLSLWVAINNSSPQGSRRVHYPWRHFFQ